MIDLVRREQINRRRIVLRIKRKVINTLKLKEANKSEWNEEKLFLYYRLYMYSA